MSDFKLTDAVTLFSQEATAISSLWTVYVAATFAAAGYGFTATDSSVVQATALTLGFSAFAIGHWSLLNQALSISTTLRNEILSALSSDPKNQFKSSIEALAGTANPPRVSLVIHLLIDACVIVILWAHVYFGRTSPIC
jgi:hypothetical protein